MFDQRKFRWINLFVRDILLILVIGALQTITHFKSTFIFFITGMLLVYICWQISDMVDENKRLI